jgi:meiotic recombination protein REC8, fungi type
MPDHALALPDLDLSNIELRAQSQQSSFLSPNVSHTSLRRVQEEITAVRVPGMAPSVSSLPAGFEGSIPPGNEESESHLERGFSGAMIGNDDGFLPDADFAFDADGNLLEFPSEAIHRQYPAVPTTPLPLGERTAAARTTGVRQENQVSEKSRSTPCFKPGERNID